MQAIRNITDHDCECRFENGIFLDDGRVFLLEGDVSEGYRVSSLTTSDSLIESARGGWTNLYFQLQVEKRYGTAVAGETSFGGAGFIGFRIEESFAWILHLHNMNNPVSINLEDRVVMVSVDSPYPLSSVFRIPIDEPETFTMTQAKHA